MEQEAKFEIQDLLGIAMVFVVLGLVLTYSGEIEQDTRDDFITNTAGCNSTDQSSCGTGYDIANESLITTNTFSEKSNTIAKVAVAAVIIGILLTYFYFRVR